MNTSTDISLCFDIMTAALLLQTSSKEEVINKVVLGDDV